MAGFDCGGMIRTKAETACGVGSGDGWSIAQSENGGDRFGAEGLHRDGRGFFRIGETRGNGVVAPGIIEFMATVGDVDELHAEFAGGGFEAAGLVAELGGEEGDGFGLFFSRSSVHSVGDKSRFLVVRRRRTPRNDKYLKILVPGGFCSTIPGLAEVRSWAGCGGCSIRRRGGFL